MGKKKKKSKGGRSRGRASSKDHRSQLEDDQDVLNEELTALAAIFQDDFKIVSEPPHTQFKINLRPYSNDMGFENLNVSALLVVRCLPGYPHKCPKLEIVPEKGLSENDANQLLSLLLDQTEGIQYCGAYASMGVDNSLSLDKFGKDFKIEVIRLTEDEIEFDMIGIDASIANAFRRIVIAEVPTMAIEKVFIVDNTSVIADEVLAHRLGLIPLDADPRLFEYLSENDVPNERNTIVYKMNVSCKRDDPRLTVNSDQLKWLPEGSQLEMASSNLSRESRTYTSFSGSQLEVSKNPLGVKHKDITVARIGPGQAIELEAHAVKGIGKVHAKWSPVSTAWYRMLPEVVMLKEVKGEDAEKLVKTCPVKVFDIEDLGNGEKRAVVSKPRACTLCRECIRGVNDEAVELRRVKDHFIFTIESAGSMSPEVLFTEAVKILEEKCERVISELS